MRHRRAITFALISIGLVFALTAAQARPATDPVAKSRGDWSFYASVRDALAAVQTALNLGKPVFFQPGDGLQYIDPIPAPDEGSGSLGIPDRGDFDIDNADPGDFSYIGGGGASDSGGHQQCRMTPDGLVCM